MQFLRTLIVVFSAVIMTGASHLADVSQASTTASHAVALGVSMSPGDQDQATYDAFRHSVDRPPALWSIWSDWGGPTSAFPDVAFLNHLKAHKTVPLIVWQPVDPGDTNSPKYTYKKIAAGNFDTYLRRYARAAKAFGGRVLIRFAHEMDGYWFPWGMGRFNNTPSTFKAAWKHIWNLFKGPHGEGATNVRFVWSPNGCHCVDVLNGLYPGDKYVDYLSFSAFNWGSYKNGWSTMGSIVGRRMQALDSMNNRRSGRHDVRKKPIIIAETGSAPHGTRAHPGTKAAWIKDGYNLIYSKFRRIKAIVYFNVDMRGARDEVADWRLTSKGGALAVYRNLLTKAKFHGRIR